MACIAHTLHLIVAGAIIKTKAKPPPGELPVWIGDVENENGGTIPEHEEDEPLSNGDRKTMESLREFAIDDINKYLDETNEMDAVRVIVQHFRTLAVYFRKPPKAHHRLGAIQVRDYRINASAVVNLQVDCPTRWSSCRIMLQRLIYLESALVGFFTHIKSSKGRKEFKDMESKL
ncbi:hypothetical protein JG688_00012579 [Phytophthora aleatoria]|uniref:Uncharacterized protein n=1 Tax=Phytophthora aleatoria TaxID=2496075 RepID=A0A8J5IIZ9_9STRA|nr:hypothetical protein JG688_00012579 [Phytophthora aleatoria]